jgi:diguanylate cyclase (GGDEF)-like protein
MAVRYKFLTESTQDYISCQEDAAQLTEASDYLTEQVRLYVVNMDPAYMNAYFDELNTEKRRNHALEDLQQHHSDDEIYTALRNALDCSDELTKIEMYAMKLVSVANQYDTGTLPEEVRETELDAADTVLTAEEMLEKARTLVFDETYQEAKAQIQDYVSQVSEPILAETQQNQITSAEELKTAIAHDRVYLSLLLIVNIITFIVIILCVIRPLENYIRCIKSGKQLEAKGVYEFRYLARTYNDIGEKNAAYEATLKQKAEHDALTGILNRGAFDQITACLSKESDAIALLLVDVDQFKSINDTYGHEVGDSVLQKVANTLKETFRSSDYIARFGGDEFAIIMNGTTQEQRLVIREKVDAVNWNLAHPEDGLPPVSLSIGIAFSARNYSQELFEHADAALYQVKEHGRCSCEFYDASKMCEL